MILKIKEKELKSKNIQDKKGKLIKIVVNWIYVTQSFSRQLETNVTLAKIPAKVKVKVILKAKL